MKRPYFIITLFILATGCKQPLKSKATGDDYIVINLALQKMVGPDEEFKKSFLTFPEPDEFAEEQETERRDLYRDSMKARFDTVTPSLFIKDTLYRFLPYELLGYVANKQKEFSSDTLKIIRQMADGAGLATRDTLMDTRQIDPVYNYHLLFNKKQQWLPKVMLYRGTIRITKPYYNADKTMAVVIGQIKCGDPCGNKQLFLMLKKQNKWQLMRRDMLALY